MTKILPDNSDGLLTKREAAQLLRVHPRTLDGWLHQRRVPFVKFGRSRNATVRFKRADLVALVDSHRVETVVSQ